MKLKRNKNKKEGYNKEIKVMMDKNTNKHKNKSKN